MAGWTSSSSYLSNYAKQLAGLAKTPTLPTTTTAKKTVPKTTTPSATIRPVSIQPGISYSGPSGTVGASSTKSGTTPSPNTAASRLAAQDALAKTMPAKTPIPSSPPAVANPYGAASSYYTSRGGSGGGGSYGGGGGSYGGGGSGGGGGTAGGIGSGAVSEVLEGFAKRYMPAMIQDVLDNPDVIARDVLDTMGFDESGPLGNLMGQNAGYFVSQILPLLYAQDNLGKMPTAGGMVNRTAEYLQNAATPGGSVIDPMQILEMVLAESEKPTTGTQSIGSSLFAGQGPAQQRSAMMSIVNDLANWVPNARFATGLRNVASSAGNEYVRQASQAQSPYTSPFGTFLRGQLGPIP